MNKDIIITFDIYQDSLGNQNPNLIVYCEHIPDNPNSFNVEELQKSGLKKIIKLIGKRNEMADKFGRTYTYRITEKQLRGLYGTLH